MVQETIFLLEIDHQGCPYLQQNIQIPIPHLQQQEIIQNLSRLLGQNACRQTLHSCPQVQKIIGEILRQSGDQI